MLVAPGGAAADFGPPMSISPGYGGFPAAAVAPDGRAAVVATQVASTGIGLTVKGPGVAPFGPVEVVTAEATGDPRAAIAPNGDVVVAWSAPEGGMRATRRSAGGTVGPAQTVGGPGLIASRPALAADAAGNIVMVWRESVNASGRLLASWAPAGQPFGPVRTVQEATAAGGAYPSVAITGSGHALAGWSAFAGTEPSPTAPITAWVADVPLDGSPGAPQRLLAGEEPGLTDSDPVLAGVAGRALVAWSRYTRGDLPRPGPLRTAVVGADGSVSDVRTLAESSFVTGPVVAAGPGRALAGWLAGTSALMAGGATPATLAPPSVVPVTVRQGRAVSAGVDGPGNGVLLYQDEILPGTFTNPGRQDLRWSALPVGRATPCTARTLASGSLGGSPSVVMGGSGEGLAVWAQAGSVGVARWTATATACPPPPAAGVPVSAGSLTLASTRVTVRVRREPRVRVRVACRSGATRCSGPAMLMSGKRKLAEGRLRVSAGKAQTLVLRPKTKRARARLRKAGTFKARLAVRLARPAGRAQRASFDVRVRVRR